MPPVLSTASRAARRTPSSGPSSKHGSTLQGNVDPDVLLGPEEGVRQAAREAVEKTGGVGHILNLGHGILQQTPVENARAFVQAGQAAPIDDKVRVEGAR